MQVIPTVGVEGEDADKKRRAMLKQFSRLVDSSAKKAKFLSAFQKRPSSGVLDEQLGAADGSTKTPDADTDEQADAIKLEPGMQSDSGHLDDSKDDESKQEGYGTADVKMKTEQGEEEPEAEHVKKEEMTEREKSPGSNVEISSCNGDMKAEDLQAVEQGMAECLEAGKDAGKIFCADNPTAAKHVLSEKLVPGI